VRALLVIHVIAAAHILRMEEAQLQDKRVPKCNLGTRTKIVSECNRNAQEGCRNGSGIPARAFVLAIEQLRDCRLDTRLNGRQYPANGYDFWRLCAGLFQGWLAACQITTFPRSQCRRSVSDVRNAGGTWINWRRSYATLWASEPYTNSLRTTCTS
jgi:hypothetical protein